MRRHAVPKSNAKRARQWIKDSRQGSTGAVCIGLALAADQITKAVANAYSDALAGGIPVVPGFNLIFLRNDGVTFGLLGGAPWWALSGLALVVTVWLTVLLCARHQPSWMPPPMALSSAARSVMWRTGCVLARVTDFLDVYVGTWHWPAFNMADVAVVGGVGLLLLSEYRQARQARAAQGPRRPLTAVGGYSGKSGGRAAVLQIPGGAPAVRSSFQDKIVPLGDITSALSWQRQNADPMPRQRCFAQLCKTAEKPGPSYGGCAMPDATSWSIRRPSARPITARVAR